MLDINKRITCINKLLQENTIQSLTYAALEARLTIEHICYERIISSQPYYAKSDLMTWTPKQVVRQISREANEHVDKGFEVYISRSPNDPANPPVTKEDFEALDWVKLGDQVALRLRQLDSLHNALSKHALHLDLPIAGVPLETYGDAETIRKKVTDALKEFELLKDGTLLAGSLSTDYSFDCEVCKSKIRRKAELLKDQEIVSCFNENCAESYLIQVEGNQILHSIRTVDVLCTKCNERLDVPAKSIEVLKFHETLYVDCDCGAAITVGLVPHSWQEKTQASD